MGRWNLDTAFSISGTTIVTVENPLGKVGYDEKIVGLETFNCEVSKPDEFHVTVTFFQPSGRISVTAFITFQNPDFPVFVWQDQDFGTTLLKNYVFQPQRNFFILVESPDGEGIGFDFEFDAKVENCILTLQQKTWIIPETEGVDGKYSFHPTVNQREGTVGVPPNEFGLSTVSFEFKGETFRIFGVEFPFEFHITPGTQSTIGRFFEHELIYYKEGVNDYLVISNKTKSLRYTINPLLGTATVEKVDRIPILWSSEERLIELNLYNALFTTRPDILSIDVNPLDLGMTTLDFSIDTFEGQIGITLYFEQGKYFFFFGRLFQNGYQLTYNHATIGSTEVNAISTVNTSFISVGKGNLAIQYIVSITKNGIFVKLEKGVRKEGWSPDSGSYGYEAFSASFLLINEGKKIVFDPIKYGLISPVISFRNRAPNDFQSLFGVSFASQNGPVELFTMSSQNMRSYVILDSARETSGSVSIEIVNQGVVNVIKVFSANKSEFLEYRLMIWEESEAFRMSISMKEVRKVNYFPFNPPAGVLPRIDGDASLTQDGKMICELDYSIIYNNKIENYKLYNLNFLDEVRNATNERSETQRSKVQCSEVKGKNKTIPDSISYLSQFQKVDQTTFIGYSVTRLILSQELFGCFKNKYLRQRYYPCFLSLLRNSEWKDFLPFFTSPKYGVTNYHLLFLK